MGFFRKFAGNDPRIVAIGLLLQTVIVSSRFQAFNGFSGDYVGNEDDAGLPEILEPQDGLTRVIRASPRWKNNDEGAGTDKYGAAAVGVAENPFNNYPHGKWPKSACPGRRPYPFYCDPKGRRGPINPVTGQPWAPWIEWKPFSDEYYEELDHIHDIPEEGDLHDPVEPVAPPPCTTLLCPRYP